MTTSQNSLLDGAYRTSAILWVLGAVALSALRCWGGLLGWTLGSVTSIGVVKSLEIAVRHNFAPGATNSQRKLTGVSLAKLPIIVLVLIGVVLIGGKDVALVGAFCAGVLVVQTAMLIESLRSLVARKQ